MLWLCAQSSAQQPGRPIHLEAEDGQMIGLVSRATTRPWCSGGGYVTGFLRDGDKLVFNVVSGAGGMYDVRIRYCAPSSRKGYYLNVNGVKLTGMFPITDEAFAEHHAGKIELNAGSNTIAIEKYWGHHDIDCIDLTPVPTPATTQPIKPSAALSDPQATPEARALMARLVESYGRTTLSGVMGLDDIDYVREVTGKTVAIVGGDLMDYSPSRKEHGADPKEVERLIQAARDGHIMTISWHWNAPRGLIDKMITDDQGKPLDARWYKGFNANATTFDVEAAMADEKSDDYQLLVRDIDEIAVQLRKFSDAKIPVLWRPLHESEGKWFWWGTKGPDPLRKLWQMMHERLTNHHNLHNLIWVFTSYGGPGWYPGDEYVDIVGIDAYPADQRDPWSQSWELHQRQFAGRKLLALSEFGGVPDIERMRRFGEYWAYFVPWSGPVGPKKISKEELQRIMSSPLITHQD